MVARYGADAARLYSLFAAPPDRDLDWQDSGIEGIQRFLGRVYRFVVRNAVNLPDASVETLQATSLSPSSGTPQSPSLSPQARAIQRKLHQTIKRVSDDFQGRWHFNTCISAIMELVNALYGYEESVASDRVGRAPSPANASGETKAASPQQSSTADSATAALLAEVQRNLVLLLAPFAPYLAHELWEMLGEKGSLLKAPWPKYDAALAKEEELEIPVQINGKLRSRIIVPADAAQDYVLDRALADEKVQSAIAGKQVVKNIFVAGKLVNIVVK
jgi:leucyl-tRNA synthetase